jgi:mono/diheme cytochrome c family protein
MTLRTHRFAWKAFAAAGGLALQAAAWSPEQLEHFEKRVRPVLLEHCHACHGAASPKVKARLRLDARAAILAGGDSGPAAVSGDPEASLLVRAVRFADPDLQMPPRGKRLSERQVADLERWVSDGLPWPPGEVDSDTRPSR